MHEGQHPSLMDNILSKVLCRLLYPRLILRPNMQRRWSCIEPLARAEPDGEMFGKRDNDVAVVVLPRPENELVRNGRCCCCCWCCFENSFCWCCRRRRCRCQYFQDCHFFFVCVSSPAFSRPLAFFFLISQWECRLILRMSKDKKELRDVQASPRGSSGRIDQRIHFTRWWPICKIGD